MDRDKLEKAVRMVLEGIGERPDREGLKETPRRVAEMYAEIFGGIDKPLRLKSGFGEPLGPGDTVEIRDIGFYSMCEHHLLPFFGTVDVLYLPRDNRVAGFSSFAELVDTAARRPQIQERLTATIADVIMSDLQPHGVMVVVRARQLCASMRGAHKRELRTVTEAVRGSVGEALAARFRRGP